GDLRGFVPQCSQNWEQEQPNGHDVRKETSNGSTRNQSRKAAYAGSPLSGHWLRGVDLNHRPLGYEPFKLSLIWCNLPLICGTKYVRIVAELLSEEADQEEADQEEARKLAGAI